MFASTIVVFSVVLEAALLIGIIAAATRSVPGRNRWLVGGVLAGLAGAGVVAVFTGRIAELASGMGQELFNACILGVAVVMLAWHNIWMSAHGTALAQEAKRLGGAVRDGSKECSVLLTVVGLAVLREGSETVLFLYGIAAAEGFGSGMLVGGLIGVVAGVAAGYVLYAGLVRLPMRWIFGVTSALVLFLAAGLASQAARFLIQADLLPSLASPLWDTSEVLSETSLVGLVLKSLIGYDSRPAGMQLVVYVAVLVAILLGMRRSKSATARAVNKQPALS
jgi:high-affinity iron transporter